MFFLKEAVYTRYHSKLIYQDSLGIRARHNISE